MSFLSRISNAATTIAAIDYKALGAIVGIIACAYTIGTVAFSRLNVSETLPSNPGRMGFASYESDDDFDPIDAPTEEKFETIKSLTRLDNLEELWDKDSPEMRKIFKKFNREE